MKSLSGRALNRLSPTDCTLTADDQAMKLDIQHDRLTQELENLAAFSDAQAPAVTRVVFSEVDRRARTWLKGLFAEASLVVREDAVGNTFARWEGSAPDLPPMATGSHIDAIPHAGRELNPPGLLRGRYNRPFSE